MCTFSLNSLCPSVARADAAVALPGVRTCGPARRALTLLQRLIAAASSLCDGEERSPSVPRVMDEDIRQT